MRNNYDIYRKYTTMDLEKIIKFEKYFIYALSIALAIWTFFGTTMTWNGIEQPQWLAGLCGVGFMSLMVGVAFGAAWLLNWVFNAGWRK